MVQEEEREDKRAKVTSTDDLEARQNCGKDKITEGMHALCVWGKKDGGSFQNQRHIVDEV
jgi:hypothetical protein